MHIISQDTSPLLDVLIKLSPESSKTTIRSWIKEGRVTIDGRLAKQANEIVHQGQKVAIGAKIKLAADRIRIIYEDNYLIAIEKPAGLLSVSTVFQKGDTAHALLKQHFHPRKIFVVHRLDQDTSGVMLFALSEQSYIGLKDLFEKHDIERSYCAIVEGCFQQKAGIWKSYLFEDEKYVVHSSENPHAGELAITHYEVNQANKRYSRLNLKLETGKKNQIRVHCNDEGYPVAGDKKYGAQTDPLKRLCLHSQLIAFDHPITGKKMRFTSPPPESFSRLA